MGQHESVPRFEVPDEHLSSPAPRHLELNPGVICRCAGGTSAVRRLGPM